MHRLIQLDKSFFLFLNNKLSNPAFDLLMPFIRNPMTWIPFYVFLFAWALINLKRSVWWWIVFSIATVALADQVSSNLIKENIHRVRPVLDPEIMDRARFLLSYRSKNSSFTSSHATNHFALAAFWYSTLKPFIGNKGRWLYAWAALICFAQVYVGVHFPLDVICGGIIGFMIGKFTFFIFTKNFHLELK